MKAIAKCPNCGKVLKTSCVECIKGNICVHECVNGTDAVEVKWKSVTPENEKELNEIKRMKCNG